MGEENMKKNALGKFWMVWREGGEVPTVRHFSDRAAWAEAERLAKKEGSAACRFHVLEALGSVTAKPAEVVREMADGHSCRSCAFEKNLAEDEPCCMCMDADHWQDGEDYRVLRAIFAKKEVVEDRHVWCGNCRWFHTDTHDSPCRECLSGMGLMTRWQAANPIKLVNLREGQSRNKTTQAEVDGYSTGAEGAD
jgi:hypothetical protein